MKWYYKLFQSGEMDSDWRVFENDPRLDPVLKQMMLAFDKVAAAEQSSAYWRVLNKKNVQQLLENGFDNFKQTVALNYFTFLREKNNPHEVSLREHLPPEIAPGPQHRPRPPRFTDSSGRNAHASSIR